MPLALWSGSGQRIRQSETSTLEPKHRGVAPTEDDETSLTTPQTTCARAPYAWPSSSIKTRVDNRSLRHDTTRAKGTYGRPCIASLQ